MSNRVVVVGAGVVGLWIAYELKKHNFEVTVIDQGTLGSGSSYGNAGWVIPARTLPLPSPGLHWEGLKMLMQPDSPLYVKPTSFPRLTGWLTQFMKYCNEESYRHGCQAMASLSVHAHPGYDSLIEDGFEFEMHEHGLLSVYLDETVFAAGYKDHQTMERFGLGKPEKLNAKQVREMQPKLGEAVIGGVFIKEARHIDPESLLAAFAKWLQSHDVELHFETEVVGFRQNRGRITGVNTRKHTYESDHVVVATGAKAGQLVRQLGYVLPMQAGKGYSLSFETEQLEQGPALFLGDAKIACTPLNRGTRFAGTIEFSGINTVLEKRRIQSLHQWIPRYVPGYDSNAKAEQWVGMRPVTPDGLPVIGRIPQCANAYIASGHSTAGLPLAPATARHIVGLIRGENRIEIEPFRPERFS